jgi:hypothetical protein
MASHYAKTTWMHFSLWFAVSVAWKPFFHFNLEDVGSLFQTASVNLQIRTDRPNFLYWPTVILHTADFYFDNFTCVNLRFDFFLSSCILSRLVFILIEVFLVMLLLFFSVWTANDIIHCNVLEKCHFWCLYTTQEVHNVST